MQRRWLSSERFGVTALDNVSLTVKAASTLALVGESGSGKSTLARCLTCLEPRDSGEIWFEGKNLGTLSRRDLFTARGNIQLIFQDSASAMNPHFSAADIIGEPLKIRQGMRKKESRESAMALMDQVGLSPEWANRSPQEFSGGQRQRLAIARALAVRPTFLILDEALSGLDLSIQAQIANLLSELQTSFSLTYLYITHDLLFAAHLADEIAVMQNGRIVEHSPVAELLSNPRHPHTRALLAAIPRQEMLAHAGSNSS